MRKYLYTASAAFFLLSANCALAVSNVEKLSTQAAPKTSADFVLAAEKYTEVISPELLNKWKTSKTSFFLSPYLRAEFENSSYCPVSKIYCNLTLTTLQQSHIRLSSEYTIEKEAIRLYIEDFAKKVNRDPIDAKFMVEEGKVTTFSEAQDGITLDTNKSIETISEALKKNSFQETQKIELPYDTKKTTVNYADVNNLGVSSLIGEGTSNFKGSPVNRIKNIKVATSRFNGVLIKPGEEFSFIKTLGDVDEEHGYFPELVIKKGVTEPEFGGGVCQVSTTAFRAAIYSGLKITARRNHAYPVSYYNPAGMDSTVYVPNPDLKFINNTPNHILIQAKIVGTVLTFNFYGTDDGRKTTVAGPYITEKQPDGALKANFTQHVLDKDGNELINDVFNSSYNSPYKYPHLGGPTLSAKPSNWSDDEWKTYKKTLKDLAKEAAKKQ